MEIASMNEFQDICLDKLIDRYEEITGKRLSKVREEVFIVWAVKVLQNYKCLVSTSVNGDGVYVEYTFNGDKGELYEDFYIKECNNCYRD